jgi:hypothetical protein
MRSKFAVSLGALAIAVAIAVPSAAPAAPRAATGDVYGGFVPHGWPVVLQFSRDRRKLVRSEIGLDLKCGSGYESLTDGYVRVPVSKSGAFRESYGPVRDDNADGSFDVYTSSFSGKLNRAGTVVSGTWRLIDAEHNVAGALTDTCDSGTIHWSARQ